MRLISIPSDAVEVFWPVIAHLIEASTRRGGDTPDELRALCAESRGRLLVVVDDDNRPVLAGVAVLTGDPLVCQIIAAGGSGLREWRHLEPELERWAAHHDAGELQFMGRLGWNMTARKAGFNVAPGTGNRAVYAKALRPTG